MLVDYLFKGRECQKYNKKSLKIFIICKSNRRRTDNTVAKRKWTVAQCSV